MRPLFKYFIVLVFGVAIVLVILLFVQAVGKPKRIQEHNGMVRSISLSSNKRYIASGGEDGRVIVWDLQNSRIYRDLDLQNVQVYKIALSPNSQQIAICLEGTSIIVWDIVEDTTSASSEVNSCFQDLIWLNDNTITTKDLELSIYEVGSLKRQASDLYPSTIWDSLGDRLVLFNRSQGTITALIDNQTVQLPTDEVINLIQWNPDGNHLATANSMNKVDIWSLDSQAIEQTISYPFSPHALHWSNNGNILAVVTGDLSLIAGHFQIHFYSLKDTSNVSTIDIPPEFRLGHANIAWSVDSSLIAVPFEPDPNRLEWFGEVWIIDPISGDIIEKFELSAPSTALVWASERNLVIGSTDGSIEMWQIQSNLVTKN